MMPLAVIDDDPTGAQTEAGVPLLLEWPAGALRDRAGVGAVHLLTNSRALDDGAAYRVVRDASEAATRGMPERQIVLRGDSTLRAHLLAEYLAVRDGTLPAQQPPLVLVPALPSAGRVTVDGVHWLAREGRRVPIADTEFARDSRLGYSSSRLLDWAQERSGGHFRALDGRELHLHVVRAADGAGAVATVLSELAEAKRPAVLVPDAENLDDLHVIAAGLAAAKQRGVEAVIRCAPAFVGVAAGTTATALTAPPSATRGILVVVGSHVPTTTRQLELLTRRRPAALIEIDAGRLASAAAREGEIEAASRDARERLAADRLAVVATSRETPAELLGPEPGMRIASGLAAVVSRTRDGADVIVSKGGITSAVNVHEGLNASEALVLGPLADGIALWRVRAGPAEVNLVVFPGNVGGEDALADVVDALLAAADFCRYDHEAR